MTIFQDSILVVIFILLFVVFLVVCALIDCVYRVYQAKKRSGVVGMKANEYVKKYGVDCAKEILTHNQDLMNIGFFIDLKRLVESHEWVESYGGIDAANKTICDAFHGSNYPIPEGHEKLSLAIQDVESCQ